MARSAAVCLLVGLLAGALLVGPMLGAVRAAPPDLTPSEARQRVEHHLQAVEELTRHFESVLGSACPHFQSSRDWKHYFDGEVDHIVLLLAHLEQAWVEAKRTGDDDVRRTAKAPRHRIDQARELVDKLQTCADDNGTSFAPLAVWRKIEREVPKRQAEIALPR
jgi:hypothetical protein